MTEPGTDLTIYSTMWCGYCSRLKAQMSREGISFTDVDIEVVPEAAAIVEAVNGGNQTVPTLVFADGTAMTNPPIGKVKQQLAQMRGVSAASPGADAQ